MQMYTQIYVYIYIYVYKHIVGILVCVDLFLQSHVIEFGRTGTKSRLASFCSTLQITEIDNKSLKNKDVKKELSSPRRDNCKDNIITLLNTNRPY